MIPVVELSINKTVDFDTVYVGDTVVFTINVTNNGPSNATVVVISDVVPEQFNVTGATGGFDVDSNSLTVDFLAVNESAVFTITAVALVNGTWNNTASVVCKENDTEKNSTVNVTVVPVADLEIVKLVSNVSAHYGDIVNWTIVVTNLGPNTAVNVVVNEIIPDGLIVLDVIGGVINDNVWSVGNLTCGSNATLIIVTQINTTNDNITNVVNTTSDTYDPNETNNNATNETIVPPEADLEVNKTVSDASAHYGDVVTWTITVKNNGPDVAVDAWVDDVVPVELVDVSVVSVDQGDFANNVWTIGNLTSGQVVALVISTKVNATNVTIVNNVTVNSTTYDPNETNNNGTNETVVPPEADLFVDKVAYVTEARVGNVVVWTIAITNLGPDVAVNVTVSDVIPAELVFSGVYTADRGSFDGVTWKEIGDMAVGESLSLIVETTIAKSDVNITNVANVTSDTYDPNETNNRDNDTVEVPPEADLEVNKTVSNASAHNGDAVVWTITVTNNGPDAAVNVTVTDVLPEELINPEVINLGHAGKFEDNVWFIEEIASGDSKVLVIRTVVNATNTTIVNVVNVTSDTYDPNETNNNASNETDVPPEADLEINKAVSDASAHKGDVVTWTITVTNNGPDAAVNVTVTDVIPDELIYKGVVSIDDGSFDGEIWFIDEIASGETLVLVINTTVAATNTTIVNNVNVTSDTYDPNEENNNGTNNTVVPPEADLAIAKGVVNESAHKGDIVDWVIVVINFGPDVAVNAVVEDVLPAELIYNGTVEITAGNMSADGKTWTIGDIRPGQIVSVTIRTIVNTTNMSVINAANVSSETYDPDMSNNNDSDVIVIPPEADLTIVKLVSDASAHKGDLVSWTIVVTNNGPDDAVNVVVEDVIPSGLDVVNVSGGKFADNTWTVGNLSSGESATLIIVTLIDATNATIVNNVNTTSDTYDPDESNNNGTNSTVVPPGADLEVIKSNDHEDAKCYYGDIIKWDITVVNHGPNGAVNAIVVDKLPAGLKYVSDDSAGAYDPETGVWNVGNLTSGASVTLHIETILTDSNANITNPVNVTSDTYDPDESNNKDNSSVNVVAEADLEVIKLVSNSTAHKNDKIIWTIIVTNNGRDTAVNTVVNEKLPSGVIYVSDDSAGAYDSDAGIWKVGDLACGKSATLHIVTLVTATNVTIINTVDVTSDTYDPNETNNKCNNSTTVPPEVDLVITVEPDVTNVTVGDKVVWTITVVNQGPDTAINSRAYVIVPDGLKLLGFKPSKGTYDPYTGIWTIGDLAPGEKVTLLLDTKALVAGKFVVKAYTECDIYESDYTNNFDEAEINVTEPEGNETEPPVVVPPRMHATGNPIVMALLSLVAIVGLSLKRKS